MTTSLRYASEGQLTPYGIDLFSRATRGFLSSIAGEDYARTIGLLQDFGSGNFVIIGDGMKDERISMGVPSLFNGISQQSPNLRLPSQAADQVNLYSSLVRGLVKRPPTSHVAKLRTSSADDAFVHWIDRDATERYSVFLLDQDIEVYDTANGSSIPVYSPNGKTYLDVTTPRDEFRAVSIADYTIIVNTSKVAAMDGTETAENAPEDTAYLWVKRGNYGTTYSVTLDGTSYSTTTANPTTTSPTYFSTDTIATNLGAAITDTNFTVTVTGSLVKVVKTTAGPTFTFGVGDSYAGDALIGLKMDVGAKEDLPDNGLDGMAFRITGASRNSEDDYYVRYNTNSGEYKGIWEEYRGWDQSNVFDTTTMPHRLVRQFVDGTETGALDTWITNESLGNGDTYFLFDEIDWDDRLVGDDITSAIPAFIGKNITDVFFFNSRLGLLSEEWVFLSRVSDFFNFWPETVQQVLDDGPISVPVYSNQISFLRSAVPWNKALLCFSDHSQFQISSQNALTPENIKADQTTEFEASSKVKPVASGPNIYFAIERGDYTSIREYFVSEDSVTNDAAKITGHVPGYVPNDVFHMAASSNEDVLLLLSSQVRDRMWVYKYYWSGNEKLQSSWSYYKFGDNTKIISCYFFSNSVFIVIDRGGEVYLESFPMEAFTNDTGMPFIVHLDRKCSVTGVYDSPTDTTTWTLPYDEDTNNEIAVVRGDTFIGQIGREVSNVTRPLATTCVASGDHSDGPCYLGKEYESKYTFSPFYVRDANESRSAILSGKLIIDTLMIIFTNSGNFDVEVDKGSARDVDVVTKTGTLGKEGFNIGTAVIDSGKFPVKVDAMNDETTISLTNSTYFPSNWQSAEVIAKYSTIERRV